MFLVEFWYIMVSWGDISVPLKNAYPREPAASFDLTTRDGPTFGTTRFFPQDFFVVPERAEISLSQHPRLRSGGKVEDWSFK